MTLKERVKKLIELANKEPILTIRQVVWIVFGGWALFLGLIALALGFFTTLLMIPWGLVAIKVALYALCPVGFEYYVKDSKSSNPLENPTHPLAIAGNIVWLIVAGWAVVIGFLIVAIIQVFTIIGIPSALTFLQLARFALWPIGYSVHSKPGAEGWIGRKVAPTKPQRRTETA